MGKHRRTADQDDHAGVVRILSDDELSEIGSGGYHAIAMYVLLRERFTDLLRVAQEHVPPKRLADAALGRK